MVLSIPVTKFGMKEISPQRFRIEVQNCVTLSVWLWWCPQNKKASALRGVNT